MSYIPILLNGYNLVENNGAPLPQRSILNFIGATVSDNPANGSTDVTVGTGSGLGGITQLVTDVIATGPGVAVAEVAGIRSRAVANTAPVDGSILIFGNPVSTWSPTLISGDAVVDKLGELTVTGVQGYPISTTAPTSNQTLQWDVSGGYYKPGNGSAGGGITQLTGDVTAGPGSGSVVASIGAGVIVNADVNASAAIALSKLQTGPFAQIPIGDGTSFVPRAITGDVEIDELGIVTVEGFLGSVGFLNQPSGANLLMYSTGTTGVDFSKLVNAMVDNAAAIAGTKVSPDFGSQDVVTSGRTKLGGAGGQASVWVGAALSGTTYAAMYFNGNGVTPAASDYNILANSAELNLRGSGAVFVLVGSSLLMTFSTSLLTVAVPIVGDGVPWASVNGTATQAMADANQTPAASVYRRARIVTTGAITADRDLVLPQATDAQGYGKWISNTCTSGGPFGIVVKAGASGTTVTVALSKTAYVWIDSAGVTRMTADV